VVAAATLLTALVPLNIGLLTLSPGLLT